MTREQVRMHHTASRSIGWTVFMAFLTTPAGSYLYLGYLLRAGIFLLGLFGGMILLTAGCERFGWPDFVVDASFGVLLIGALGDQIGLIRASRKKLAARGIRWSPADS